MTDNCQGCGHFIGDSNYGVTIDVTTYGVEGPNIDEYILCKNCQKKRLEGE